MSKYLNIEVDEFSTPINVSAEPKMLITEVFNLMQNSNVRHLPVLSSGHPIGMISERDLSLLDIVNKGSNLHAEDIMTRDPYCVQAGTPLEAVAFEMSKRKIGSAIVIDSNEKADSIFTSVDGLNALIEIIRGDLN